MPEIPSNRRSTDVAGRTWTPEMIDSFGEESVTGILKLVQDIIVTLLTDSGSAAGPDRGSAFGQVLYHSLNITQLPLIVTGALDEVEELLADRNIDRPNDERIDYLELTSIDYVGNTADITITLVTVAGESTNIVIPIKKPVS